MIRILLADDHPMISSALEVLLRGTNFELVARARSGADALSQISRLQPDLILLDVHMPEGSGVDVLREIRRGGKPAAPVIILTAGVDDYTLSDIQKAGPQGIVLKTADPSLLLECLEVVAKGGCWVDPEIADQLDHLVGSAQRRPSLSPRERQLIKQVRAGLKNRDIASELGITEGTVKFYLHALYERLAVRNRTELAMRADEFVSSADLAD